MGNKVEVGNKLQGQATPQDGQVGCIVSVSGWYKIKGDGDT